MIGLMNGSALRVAEPTTVEVGEPRRLSALLSDVFSEALQAAPDRSVGVCRCGRAIEPVATDCAECHQEMKEEIEARNRRAVSVLDRMRHDAFHPTAARRMWMGR